MVETNLVDITMTNVELVDIDKRLLDELIVFVNKSKKRKGTAYIPIASKLFEIKATEPNRNLNELLEDGAIFEKHVYLIENGFMIKIEKVGNYG